MVRGTLLDRPDVEHGFGEIADGWWTAEDATAFVTQKHTDLVTLVDSPGTHGVGDALITDRRGLWLAVKTADCTPILLTLRQRDQVVAVAAVHAGWRGTAQKIVIKTAHRLTSEYGSGDIEAVIGPTIGLCCYEVGPEVAVHLRPWFPELVDLGDTKTRIDLPEANARQLRASGVQQVEILALCTKCQVDRFHSFRRDGEASGRLISAIRIK